MTITPPSSGGPEAYWRAQLAAGHFMLQRAKLSGRIFFPPRVAEPGTGDDDLEWIEACGLGTIYSLTIVNQKPPTPSYNVVLIDLDEDARLMSRIDHVDIEKLHVGMRVQAQIIEEHGSALLVFVPIGPSA